MNGSSSGCGRGFLFLVTPCESDLYLIGVVRNKADVAL